jgi:predicted dehydrogenase
VLLVGAGTALHGMYGPAFRFLPGARLCAVMDPWEEARARAVSDYGVRAYATLQRAIRHARPQVAIVGSPTFAHAGQVARLARAGIHVLCEKPMARTVQECDAMIAACDEAGVGLGVGFMKRFNVSLAAATRWVRSGRLGAVYEVDCEWSFPASSPPERYGHPHSDWRGWIDNWGGLFQDHGSHSIDLCRTWLGEVRSVSAQVRSVHPDVPVEDVAAVLCRHEGGGISTHRMNIRTHKPLCERYELFGVDGTLEVQWGGVWRWSAYTAEPMSVRLYRAGRERVDLTPRPEQAIDLELDKHGHYLNELRAFLAAVRRGRRPPVGGADGRAAVEVVTAAYCSAATGETVKLPLRQPLDVGAYFQRGLFKLDPRA